MVLTCLNRTVISFQASLANVQSDNLEANVARRLCRRLSEGLNDHLKRESVDSNHLGIAQLL